MISKYKNIIISCASLLLFVFPIQTAQNCGYYPTDGSQITFFNPSVLDEERYLPFHFNPDLLYGTDDMTKDYVRNCEEWQAQFSDSISVEDIHTTLYKTDPDHFIRAYHDESLLELMDENTFIRTLVKKENRPFLDYLYMAFKTEFSHFADDDPWGLEAEDERYKGKYNPKKSWINIIDSIQSAEQNFSPFLKERYGYQLVLNYRYANYPQKCVNAFDYYFANSTSIVKAWAAIHAGHAWFLLKNIPASNLAFAISFDGCESKLVRAVNGFDIQKIDSTLMLAQTPKERAAVYALGMMQNPGRGLKAIQTIAKFSPDYHYLPLLIQREINKIENWLLAPFLLNDKAILDTDWFRHTRKPEKIDNHIYYDDEWFWKDNPVNFNIRSKYYQHKNYEKDVEYLRKLRTILLKLKTQLTTKSDQDFLNLAIAHLYFLDFKPQEAWKYLNEVSRKAKPVIRAQVHIEKLLILPQIETITSKHTQAKLYKSLDWLHASDSLIHNGNETISQLRIYLGRAFFQKGRTAEAGLLNAFDREYHYSSIEFFDKYASIQGMKQTLQYYRKKNKTAFENYLCYYGNQNSNRNIDGAREEYKKIQENVLLDVSGTIAFRQDKLKTALQFFKQLPTNYWEKTYNYSYYLNDPFPHSNPNFSYYNTNKARIIKRMINLKRYNSPDSLLVLGGAYFNTSYHGRTWMMFSYGRYPNEWRKEKTDMNHYEYSFQPNADRYKREYYEASRAIYYYKKALNSRKASLEQKAEALFDIGNCERGIHRWEEEKSEKESKERFFAPHHYTLFKKFQKADNYDALMGCTNFYYDYDTGKYSNKKHQL